MLLNIQDTLICSVVIIKCLTNSKFKLGWLLNYLLWLLNACRTWRLLCDKEDLHFWKCICAKYFMCNGRIWSAMCCVFDAEIHTCMSKCCTWLLSLHFSWKHVYLTIKMSVLRGKEYVRGKMCCLLTGSKEPESLLLYITAVKFLKCTYENVFAYTIYKENNAELSLDKSHLCAIVSRP